MAHENARGVTGQVELAEQELHNRLAEMGPAFQQFNQWGEGCLGLTQKGKIGGYEQRCQDNCDGI